MRASVRRSLILPNAEWKVEFEIRLPFDSEKKNWQNKNSFARVCACLAHILAP